MVSTQERYVKSVLKNYMKAYNKVCKKLLEKGWCPEQNCKKENEDCVECIKKYFMEEEK